MNSNSPSVTHPSYLALDRASLGHASPELRQHLVGCDQCRGYLESVAEPAPATSLNEVARRVDNAASPLWRQWWSLLPVAAAASLLLFFSLRLNPQPGLPTGPYIGDKGLSSVWIYVKHGPNTQLWDGAKPLHIGDRLRLKLDPGQFQHVDVYSVKDPSAPALLYSSELTRGLSTTLPDAWEVDAEPGAERLVVVLSNAKVTPVWSDWLNGKAPPGVAVLPFVLPKTSAAAPDTSAGDP